MTEEEYALQPWSVGRSVGSGEHGSKGAGEQGSLTMIAYQPAKTYLMGLGVRSTFQWASFPLKEGSYDLLGSWLPHTGIAGHFEHWNSNPSRS